jgi:hypothetical protein
MKEYQVDLAAGEVQPIVDLMLLEEQVIELLELQPQLHHKVTMAEIAIQLHRLATIIAPAVVVVELEVWVSLEVT